MMAITWHQQLNQRKTVFSSTRIFLRKIPDRATGHPSGHDKDSFDNIAQDWSIDLKDGFYVNRPSY